MRISVIIPVYKVAQYLNECVQSVLRQTYLDLEIILVNDGSPDNCPALCDEYASQDSRFRVIHKENGGLSDARNAGLRAATGDYVIFLDSDDYWMDDRLTETLVEETTVQTNVDIILFLRTDFYEKTKKYNYAHKYDIDKIKNRDKTEVFRYLLKAQLFNMSACFQMIRRELLIHNNVFFEVGLFSEDVDYSLSAWRFAKHVSAVNIYGYCYRHRGDSITTTYSLKNLLSYDFMFAKWQKILEGGNFEPDLCQLYKGYLAYLLPTLLYNYFIISIADRKKEYEVLKKLNWVLQYSQTNKSNRAKKINSLVGFRFTCIILGLYGLWSKFGISGLKYIFHK